MQPSRTIDVIFPTDNDAKNVSIFIVGQTGSGKTVLLFNLARKVDRCVVYDIMGEFDKLPNHCSTIPGFIDALESGEKQIVFHPSDQYTHESYINAIQTILMDFQGRNPELGEVYFVCDEISKITTPQKWPRGLMELLQRGRHWKINKMVATQWLSRIPAAMRDCASEWYVFRQVDHRAFVTLSDMGWPDEIIDRISSLPDLQCIHFDGHIFELINLREKQETHNDAIKRRMSSLFSFA
jgi:hypothetical protein